MIICATWDGVTQLLADPMDVNCFSTITFFSVFFLVRFNFFYSTQNKKWFIITKSQYLLFRYAKGDKPAKGLNLFYMPIQQEVKKTCIFHCAFQFTGKKCSKIDWKKNLQKNGLQTFKKKKNDFCDVEFICELSKSYTLSCVNCRRHAATSLSIKINLKWILLTKDTLDNTF